MNFRTAKQPLAHGSTEPVSPAIDRIALAVEKFSRNIVAVPRLNVDINVAESLSWLTGRSLHVTAFCAEQALLPVVSYKE